MDKLFIVCLAACFLISYSDAECDTCCSKSSNSNTRPSIDYVQLTVQNSKGYCLLHHCDAPADGWTIHGLWPSQIGAMGPNSCNSSSRFDESLLGNDLLGKMNKEWPTLYGGDSSGFWTHEWCKHGTCAMDVASISMVTSMESFFATTINIFESLDIDNTLQNAGITHSQSDSTTYQLSKFVDVFKTKPAFECKKQGDGQIMFQARFCFSKSLDPVDCDMSWFASIDPCDDTDPVYYP